MRPLIQDAGKPARQFSKKGFYRYSLFPDDGSYHPAQAFFFSYHAGAGFSIHEPKIGLLHL